MSEAPLLTCRELIDFIAAYLDDELPRAERVRFEAHLRVCPACVSYLASYRETLRLEQQSLAADEPPPDDVPEELVRAILALRRR
jgi:anti-sigma factor RsiW